MPPGSLMFAKYVCAVDSLCFFNEILCAIFKGIHAFIQRIRRQRRICAVRIIGAVQADRDFAIDETEEVITLPVISATAPISI